ncbi:unnamed protein product [Adineta steineri]|uniref:Uncharacterized protein n=1 Tax=Adineta steineri TaxID=433720 RepID=A0A820CMU4_9BILA|nr:unnamed protein product [Adineta steineri]
MRKDLAAKLYADYPHLFWQRSLPRNQSSMHDGLCISDGWESILRQLCQQLTNILVNDMGLDLASPEAKQYAFTQVKQKLGGLRTYMTNTTPAMKNAIDDAEDKAARTFFNLNKRFQNLLTSSTLRIKIHTSFISKLIFQKYYTHFIEPYKHRIKSLHLSNPCTMHLFSNISQFSQLENLLVENTESQYLENILLHITSLSNLSSLVIHINDSSNQIQIYNQIFLLPTLKYCKISFDKNIQLEQIPISTNISSSIEHLVIIGKCYLTELHNFL